MRHRRDPIRRGRRAVSLLALLPAAALLVACGADESNEPAAEAPAVEADEHAGTPPAATPNPVHELTGADAQITKGELPKDYPSDVPVYPDAEPGTSMALPNAGMLAIFESDAPADDIHGFYRKELGSNGWVITEGRVGGLRARKDGRDVRIKATSIPGGRTQIAVRVKDQG